jgi:uncharacterized protein YdhG (YjbR/CyaY superfamily)
MHNKDEIGCWKKTFWHCKKSCEQGDVFMSKTKAKTVEEYIEAAPEVARKLLREMRAILKEVVPDATEAVKWGSPVFEEKRILFAYAAYQTHLNFMPTGPSLEPFIEELAEFKTGKGTIQFPYDQPLPKKLIQKIAAYRAMQVKENDALWMG